MKQLKRIKKYYNLSWKIGLVGLLFWLAETIAFLIIEGWHLKATSEAEIMFDTIAKTIMSIGFWCFVYAVANVVNVFSTCVEVTFNNEPIDEKK